MESRVDLVEAWIKRLFGPIFYFTPLDFEIQMPPLDFTLKDIVGSHIEELRVSRRIDDNFIRSTMFGKAFEELSFPEFKARLDEISKSNDVVDRFRKHVAKELYDLIDKYYGKSGAEDIVEGFDIVKTMFMENRRGTDYDHSHFWASKSCTPVFLPAASNVYMQGADTKESDDLIGAQLFVEAMQIRRALGINSPDQDGFADTYELARISCLNTLNLSLENPILPFRLDLLKDAVEGMREVDEGARSAVLGAIGRIDRMMKIRATGADFAKHSWALNA
jgi:hypothetical protein